MHRVWLPRLGDLLFICILTGCLLIGSRMLNIDSDLGRHLVLGSHILETQSVPVRDILSFTMSGEPRPPYEWLAQILFAASNRLLGLDGVVLATSVAIATTFFLTYLDARARSGTPLTAIMLTVWAAAASSLHWLTRPHVFSFLCLALWLRLLERLRLGHKQPVWQLPLLMLLWANLHGGFIVGFLAWTAYVAGWIFERRRRQSSVDTGTALLHSGAMSLMASVVTPDLWHNWTAVLQNNSTYVLARTAETMPVDLTATGSWPFLGFLGLATLLAWQGRRSTVPAHTFLLIGLAALGVMMARNIPLFCIGAVPILATWSRQSIGAQSRFTFLEQHITMIESNLRNFFWPPLVVSIAAGLLVYQVVVAHRSIYAYSPALFPVQAADWLEEHPVGGHMFNELNWGGYLLYRLWPGQLVFIDSQTDFYGEQHVRDYAVILDAAEGWEDELIKQGISFVVVPPYTPLADRLRMDSAWQVAYQDATAVILVRKQT
jgi:hypothetical protein